MMPFIPLVEIRIEGRVKPYTSIYSWKRAMLYERVLLNHPNVTGRQTTGGWSENVNAILFTAEYLDFIRVSLMSILMAVFWPIVINANTKMSGQVDGF